MRMETVLYEVMREDLSEKILREQFLTFLFGERLFKQRKQKIAKVMKGNPVWSFASSKRVHLSSKCDLISPS